ncbi:HTH-type transcriptional regulator LutR [Paenibacillus marchantiophytorum]|uniref:HTH-type transcriptional regulator LutR n=1 Tax=Paenibacillus marchantiophytorum TaxID=1619310 RepID=A0ABQ1EX76_9BACL|nr:FadR/GntR family transcriptional regulator [Paenibacillus marchantiophytorum]GFZ91245.1 HTH-type transcriptional regulator LutR [Paenibacillus marchantiophytorum]
MTFPQIKPQKGSEIVMTHIKQQIQAGTYLPGAKLPTVDQLAANFEVGRSTIREAMSALKAMGWVDIRHGGGTFVSLTLPSEEGDNSGSGRFFYQTESFQEVLEVRKFIEAGCASLAAERRTEEDLRLLEVTIQEMEAAIGDESLSEQADIRFHLTIARASHNSLFVSMMESLTDRLQESMKESRRLWFFAERASVELLIQEHKDIYEAIKLQHVKLAEDRVMQHILKVDRVVHKLDAGSR